MMPVPFIDGAKTDNNGNPIRVNASSAGDFMVIPKNAPNKEGALKFMKFINTREMIYQFTKDAQSVRPFQYKTTEIEGLTTSAFTASCFEIYDNSKTLYQFSNNPLFWNVLVGKWPGIGAPYNRMVIDGETAKDMCTECYNHASSNWQAFLDQIK
jgi:N-acetylglucosamine transport system substrate-binding protein